MKIYFHLNLGGFSNCYLVVNERNREAIIIDPGRITEKIINRIEENEYKLAGILITHNHGSHVHGLKTLMKIYSPKIYGADWEIAEQSISLITGDGKIRLAGFTVHYMHLPGHTFDSMVYKIGNVLFTGDSLTAGRNGSTNSSYSDHILRMNIEEKIFSQQDSTVIMPGHGPPTCIGAERQFNINMQKENYRLSTSETRPQASPQLSKA
ncbi:MAG: MBL fold metallo-hydrolase [Treponemataceae bacterium]|nr:MBL fold metallo-hydrolase [Treponemataceae bacterium]